MLIEGQRMNSVELKDYLLEYCDVQPGMVDQLVKQIQGFASPLQKEFYAYLESQELSEECRSLMDKQGLLPVGAFIMRDWMEKEPDAAKLMMEYF